MLDLVRPLRHGPPLRSGRVLVVEDDPDLLRAFRRALQLDGHRVLAARDSVSALTLLADQRFDVLVSDIELPDLDGTKLLAAARSLDIRTPVVFVTGAPTVGSAQRALEFGAFRYVQKPIDPVALRQLVSDALRHGQKEQVERDYLDLIEMLEVENRKVAKTAAVFEENLARLWLAYQPIVCADMSDVVGHEALLRSHAQSFGGPLSMIAAAEKLDRVSELGRVVRRAVSESARNAPVDTLFFVNLHAQELLDDDLYDPRAPLSRIAHTVVLEITERTSLHAVPETRKRLRTLRQLGFRLAVDDLGAGYAGLGAIVTVEPEFMKIEEPLVRDIDRSRTKRSLVRAIAAVARDLGSRVVAEGVETEQERQVLVDLGCDLLQGYLFAKPAPAFLPKR